MDAKFQITCKVALYSSSAKPFPTSLTSGSSPIHLTILFRLPLPPLDPMNPRAYIAPRFGYCTPLQPNSLARSRPHSKSKVRLIRMSLSSPQHAEENQGIPLYMASSVFIRHTLNTLYSDLRVELQRVTWQNTPKHGDSASEQSESDNHSGSKRDKSLFVGLCVRGTSRVSGGLGEWQV